MRPRVVHRFWRTVPFLVSSVPTPSRPPPSSLLVVDPLQVPGSSLGGVVVAVAVVVIMKAFEGAASLGTLRREIILLFAKPDGQKSWSDTWGR